jgi:signal transduction histidine kinase
MEDHCETPHLIPMAVSVRRTSHTLRPRLVSGVRLGVRREAIEKEIMEYSSSMVFDLFSFLIVLLGIDV